MRAAATLAAVDFVVSEDTRHSRRLLDYYSINTPLSALHDHNETQVVDQLLARLREGTQACALISDAGTPLISDPGYVLVRAAHVAGVPVFAVPGACAAIAALSISGMPTDRFLFEGFLPSQTGARLTRLAALAQEARTLVFYEAPHRLQHSVSAMCEAFGPERPAVIARELTKRFETIYRGSLAELDTRLHADVDATRGEFVVIVGGRPATSAAAAEVERLLRIVMRETDRRTAVRIVAALSGHGRNEIYQASLNVPRGDNDVEN